MMRHAEQSSQTSQIGMASRRTFLIRVEGVVGAKWLDYFDDLAIVIDFSNSFSPVTTLCIHAADQTALLGLLQRLYTFGYPLLYIKRLDADLG